MQKRPSAATCSRATSVIWLPMKKPEYGKAMFDRSIRAHIAFSDHSLATDSVIVGMEFGSSRNVVIYFDRPLQDSALGLVHETLCRSGFLGLGMEESIRFSAHADNFVQIVQDKRIFQKRDINLMLQTIP